MACLGVEPREAGWKAQMNPLSYGGTPSYHDKFVSNVSFSIIVQIKLY